MVDMKKHHFPFFLKYLMLNHYPSARRDTVYVPSARRDTVYLQTPMCHDMLFNFD